MCCAQSILAKSLSLPVHWSSYSGEAFRVVAVIIAFALCAVLSLCVTHSPVCLCVCSSGGGGAGGRRQMMNSLEGLALCGGPMTFEISSAGAFGYSARLYVDLCVLSKSLIR